MKHHTLPEHIFNIIIFLLCYYAQYFLLREIQQLFIFLNSLKGLKAAS